MRVGVRWLDEGEGQDYICLLSEHLLEKNVQELPVRHDILKPNGRLFAEARVLLSVSGNKVVLDGDAFAEHNRAQDLIFGVVTFDYQKDAKPRITNVWFKDVDKLEFGPCRVEYVERPTKNRLSFCEMQEEFNFGVRHAQKLSLSDLERLLPPEGAVPRQLTVTTEIFARNPYVVAYALQRADGQCEECKQKAPFRRKSDRTEYLEVHHRKPLSEGGTDDTANVIAVCPNCHRKFHYG